MDTIIIGDIELDVFAHLSPLDALELAFQIAKDEFCIETNNAQMLYLLSILSDNLLIFLTIDDKYKQIDITTAYQYLGEIYEMISKLEIVKAFGDEPLFEYLTDDIKKYQKKYKEVIS